MQSFALISRTNLASIASAVSCTRMAYVLSLLPRLKPGKIGVSSEDPSSGSLPLSNTLSRDAIFTFQVYSERTYTFHESFAFLNILCTTWRHYRAKKKIDNGTCWPGDFKLLTWEFGLNWFEGTVNEQRGHIKGFLQITLKSILHK